MLMVMMVLIAREQACAVASAFWFEYHKKIVICAVTYVAKNNACRKIRAITLGGRSMQVMMCAGLVIYRGPEMMREREIEYEEERTKICSQE